MDKAELIRHEIEKRRDHNLAIGNPLFAAMAEEDIELLSFIDFLQEEPVSEDFEEAIGQSFIYHENRGDDFRSDKQIETAYRYGFETGAKWGKNQAKVEIQAQSMAFAHGCQKELVSEQLEEAAFDYAEACKYDGGEKLLCVEHFKAGANWQKAQMMKDAIIATIESDLDSHGADYGNQKIICGWGELEAKKFKNGSKVKLIIIKED